MVSPAARCACTALARIVAIAMALAALAAAPPARGEETPAAGTDRAPHRIVSLNPSLTAILVAVGARDLLVGVDSFSAQAQPEVAQLPAVGGLFNPSLEAIVGLSPDLVVLVPSAEQRDLWRQLGALGIRVESFDPVSFADVLATIEKLGDRVGRGDAARARVAAIRAARAAVEARASSHPRLRAVLVLQRDPLFVAGRGTFVDDMMGAAGADNAAREFAEPWPRVTQEWLLAAQPELILDAGPENASRDAASYWARWPSLPAVQQRRVVAVPDGVVTLPGPWLDDAVRTMGAAVAGEALPAPAHAPASAPTPARAPAATPAPSPAPVPAGAPAP